ncbi:hypothetical protein K402DRAFT_457455 [Aulographum hederae CBS 113979]|uniref:UspA domain-containing protein n=1 Tax=Aulographum hederae CBS 113979 TaxID=1176131 RepID=A0A6G1GNG1_9PEZI|nr:hypothetical protein K402DRAFT_457455 [Aulographum hederae CBS 113979]
MSPTHSPKTAAATVTDSTSSQEHSPTSGAPVQHAEVDANAAASGSNGGLAGVGDTATVADGSGKQQSGTVSPLILPAGQNPVLQDVRRPSIQFARHSPSVSLPTGSPKPHRPRAQRKMSSPPPPPIFQPRVSFDTFEKDKEKDKEEITAFTLIKKHKDYEYTKRSRTFLCGLDSNAYSEFALEWLLDELVDDGDEVVCLRVVEKDSSIASPVSKESLQYRAEADRLLDRIKEKNTENKAINLILEFAIGKVTEVIDDMIKLYEPAILIVGTRGRSLGGFQGLMPGSVSKYCLQHSPVPVIVVRPNSKRDKIKRKRLQDPSRQGYRDLLDKAGTEGSHLLDVSNFKFVPDPDDLMPLNDNEDEAEAVAKAIGYKPSRDEFKGSPLVKAESAPSDITSAEDLVDRDEDVSPEALRRVMKSPDPQNLESPELTEDESDEEEDQRGRSVEAAETNTNADAANDENVSLTKQGSGDVGGEEGDERRLKRKPKSKNENPAYRALGIP